MSSRRDPGPGGGGRWDLDLHPPVALVAGTWDDDGRSLARTLVRNGFRVLGPGPGTGADTPQLVVLPADADPEATAAALGPVAGVIGRSVRCGPVGPGARVDVRVVLLDTGTWAQREAAASGLSAVVGVLLTEVPTAGPAGRTPGTRGR
jgi:hypothetical protein